MDSQISYENTFDFEDFFLAEIEGSEEIYEIPDNTKLPDILRMYMIDIEKYPLLTACEEKELGKILKNVKNCSLIDKNNPVRNELDYNLFINNLILHLNDKDVATLAKAILRFIKKKPNPDIKKISYLLNNPNKSHSLINGTELFDLDVFKKNLKIYLNYLKAKEKMINSNLRLVISFAKRYANYKINLIDLINEGNIGLIIATENFDIDKGYRFSTYAMWWIRQTIFRYLYANSFDITTPEWKLKEVISFKRSVEELEKTTGKTYSNEELAALLNIDYKKIIEYMNIKSSFSLDAPIICDDNDETTLRDVVSNNDDIVEEAVFKTTLSKDIECLFQNLTSQEKLVISLRFGLWDEEEKTYTLEAIAKMQNVTKERIRAIEAKALNKMRKAAENNPKVKQLKIYIS